MFGYFEIRVYNRVSYTLLFEYEEVPANANTCTRSKGFCDFGFKDS